MKTEIIILISLGIAIIITAMVYIWKSFKKELDDVGIDKEDDHKLIVDRSEAIMEMHKLMIQAEIDCAKHRRKKEELQEYLEYRFREKSDKYAMNKIVKSKKE